MLIDNGAPLGLYGYDGVGNTNKWGGICLAPSAGAVFPAMLDSTGVTPVVATCYCGTYLTPNGIQATVFPTVQIYSTKAQALAGLNALILADPSQLYFTAYPTSASPSRTFSSVIRALNTAYQISIGQDAQVSYAVDISITSALLAGAQGNVMLQIADNSAFTTNVVTLASGTNSTSGVLNLTNVATIALNAIVPAGKWVKIVTTTVSGSPTFTARQGQEVLI